MYGRGGHSSDMQARSVREKIDAEGCMDPSRPSGFLLEAHVVDVVECGSNVHRGVN